MAIPLVVVEGFLGGNFGASLWRSVEDIVNELDAPLDERSSSNLDALPSITDANDRRKLLIVSVGPASSLHDRACELYYALRGGTVDYGFEHSETHNHARFGRTNSAGTYPEWSKDHPLHFLGHSIIGRGGIIYHQQSYFSPHNSPYSIGTRFWAFLAFLVRFRLSISESEDGRSLWTVTFSGLEASAWAEGGPTIVKLQYLISIGHFGTDAHPDMILSVHSISAAFRGTQLVYTLGESTHSAPSVRHISIGALLAKLIHIFAYISPLVPYSLLWDLHAESRSLSYRDISIPAFFRHLWRSDWAESKDATPYDMTFEAADERESRGEGDPFPNTFYQSLVFSMTERLSSSGPNHGPPLSWMVSGPLFMMSRAIGVFDFSLLRPLPKFCERHKHSEQLINSTSGPTAMEAGVSPDSHLDQSHWANDGVVPVFSQYHPFECSPSKCNHRGPLDLGIKNGPFAGRWIVQQLVESHSHFSFVPPIRTRTTAQTTFWKSIGSQLDSIDSRIIRGQHTQPQSDLLPICTP
ncbi:alpha/beta-hydrolase [Coprinopsis marcescibilis]|uniref:Alpha/beta-hydrolase n=1 Tax=Coprinopsis marcescibilis TaxID=230819 RepID=A0A5C3LG49_COPMA|nr:alpha/beta-hydrolase [Coprinopsis marcescibilis]